MIERKRVRRIGTWLLLEETCSVCRPCRRSGRPACPATPTPSRLSLVSTRQRGADAERMAHETCPRKKVMPISGNECIAVTPIAAVQRVEIHRLAANRTNRDAAADDLAIRRDVGLDAKERLAAARMRAKSSDDFVEHQRSFRFLGDAPHLAQKIRPAPARGWRLCTRLDQHGG